MVYKHIRGMNALAWDKCTRPIVFKPAQIHQYIKVTANINIPWEQSRFSIFGRILLSVDLIKLGFRCQ